MSQLQVFSVEPGAQDSEEMLLATGGGSLSINMRAAVGLLEIFAVAIVLAFSVTVATGTTEMRLVATVVIIPITILNLLFIYYCRRRKAWSYAGACILGALGIILRVIVSTQPSLEVGGGLPTGVTALYIVLGALLSLKSYESLLELRT